ncbi:MAG: Mu transposase C-terminal domain-containing protein [Burkholderiales bacterium]|nr:Mu transposase C-terminal domain-containing protein [Burkholderiales bacterium]
MALKLPTKVPAKGIFQLRVGSVVYLGKEKFAIIRIESPTVAIARNLSTMVDRPVTGADITSIAGLETVEEHGDLAEIGAEKLETALEKFKIIQPVLDGSICGRKAIQELAESSGYSVASIYQWIKAFKKTGVVSGLIRKTRADINKPRLPDSIEGIITKVLKEDFNDQLAPSPTAVQRKVATYCRRKKLRPPSLKSIRLRIAEQDPVQTAKSRGTHNDVLAMLPRRGSFPGADTPYSVIQIDHTPLDIEVVDEKDRIAIGKPWITVAIDVHSRMVVGWYVSIDPPGTLSTGICIANAILPKHNLLANLGLDYPWPCAGRMGVIHADNAREFRGNALKLACQEHGIDIKFRKVKKPHYGGHIERLLGTLLTELHAVPGTTKSNPKAKGDYRSDAEAILTLDELESWLAHLILGEYHHRVHGGLGVPPIRKYIAGICGDDQQPGIGTIPIVLDEDRLRLDFLPFEERVVNPGGIVLNYIHYYSPILNPWIGVENPEKGNSKQFRIKYDPRNMSFIYFYDPRTRLYHRVPYADPSRPAISLWEINAIRRYLDALNIHDINEDVLFKAREEMLKIEEKAKQQTKKVARERERKRTHDRAATPGGPLKRDRRVEMPPAVTPAFDHTQVRAFDEVEEL